MSGRAARAAKRRKFRTLKQLLKDIYLPVFAQMSLYDSLKKDIAQILPQKPTAANTFYTFTVHES
jgi:hypothetical protein